MSTIDSKFNYQNGLLNFPQPFVENDSLMMNFLFKADINLLQQVCDNWLNKPTNEDVYYQVLLPSVLVTFADNKQCGPTSEPYCNWGVVNYSEAIFSIFVVRLAKEGEVWVAKHLSAIVPYIFVSDTIAMVTGREIYGLPKVLGWINMPADPKNIKANFTLEAVGIPKFEKGSPFGKDLLCTITKTSDNSLTAERDWANVEEAIKDLRKIIFGEGHILIPGINLIVEIAELLIEKTLPFTALRQVRSISHPEETVYKAIVNFNAKMTKFMAGGIIKGSYQLQMPENAVFPIATDLGLANGQMAEVAFYTQWSFLFESGSEVWMMKEKATLMQRIENVFENK